MTRREYEAVADAIRKNVEALRIGDHVLDDPDGVGRAALRAVTSSLARTFAEQNPRFDASKFTTACGF